MKVGAIQAQMLKEAGISIEEWQKALVSVEEFCRLFEIKNPAKASYSLKRLIANDPKAKNETFLAPVDLFAITISPGALNILKINGEAELKIDGDLYRIEKIED